MKRIIYWEVYNKISRQNKAVTSSGSLSMKGVIMSREGWYWTIFGILSLIFMFAYGFTMNPVWLGASIGMYLPMMIVCIVGIIDQLRVEQKSKARPKTNNN